MRSLNLRMRCSVYVHHYSSFVYDCEYGFMSRLIKLALFGGFSEKYFDIYVLKGGRGVLASSPPHPLPPPPYIRICSETPTRRVFLALSIPLWLRSQNEFSSINSRSTIIIKAIRRLKILLHNASNLFELCTTSRSVIFI